MNTAGRDRPAPLPSATVVLVRAAAGRPEILLVRRNARSSFSAAYVFPGGVLDTADCAARGRSSDASRAHAARCLGLGDEALDYYSAAVRELFEETGVLLAHDARGRWALHAATAATFRRERQRLNDGDLCWSDLLERHRLSLPCDRLHYIAHWITPLRLPRRFTTRFFAAALPDGQEASHDGAELTDSRWSTAVAALAADRDGELELPPPTRTTLQQLAGHESVDELLGWAERRQSVGIEACLPAIVGAAGAERVVMPGQADYPPHGGGEP